MTVSDDGAMECRLGEFLNGRIGRHLARREQRESFALYAHGILADGERIRSTNRVPDLRPPLA